MYARMLVMTLGTGMREKAERIADEFNASYKAMKGFVSGTFLGEPKTGEYASLIIWKSLEDLKAAAKIGRPKFELATGGILKGPPSIRIYEVCQPK